MPHSTEQQGHAAKVAPCCKYMWMLHRLGCGIPFDAARPKNLIGKLSVPQRKPHEIDATTLFSVVLKTADRVVLMPTPANGVPTKGECVAYMIHHKYKSMHARMHTWHSCCLCWSAFATQPCHAVLLCTARHSVDVPFHFKKLRYVIFLYYFTTKIWNTSIWISISWKKRQQCCSYKAD